MEENSAHPRNPDLTQRETAQACAGIVSSFVLWACLHHAQTFLYALQPLWMLMVIPLWLVDFVWFRWTWRQKMVPLVSVAASHWLKVMMHQWNQQKFPKMNNHKTECVGARWCKILLVSTTVGTNGDLSVITCHFCFLSSTYVQPGYLREWWKNESVVIGMCKDDQGHVRT